ncbi:MAG: choice-of-anchor J domain-containing protein [Flavobacterium sp. JAD_PAG50586_2]|nr:MAG: choice-of-anchor J domain-containing protein [Flavobacterium sp. JAD_PAG50586_2]
MSTYTPLATSSVAYAAPWDDHVSGSAFLAPIGFNFVYDGITQTQCYISPNGFVSFGIQPAPNTYLPLSVATSFTNGGTISALGMDLISTSSSATDNIVYNTIGSAPNRVFVVQWNNARRKAVTGNFNFQIRLVETTNRIEISYGACLQNDASVLNTQVGIRGDTSDFLQGNVNNRFQTGANVNFAWSGRTVSGTLNSNTVRTSLTEYPNTGLKYVYTPSPSCTTPTGVPSGLVIGSTSVTPTSFVGNSFTAATPAPTNYLVVRSTSNVPPNGIDIVNRTYWAVNDLISGAYTVVSTSNATTFTQTGLTPNTTYYYWAIPYNAGCLGGPFYNLSNMISTSKTTCISEPLGVTALGVAGNSFIASWGVVTGATDYTVDVSTSNTFATLLPGYSAASTSGATSLSITGLSSLTTYYFRVRAIGIGCNTDSLTGTATTICGGFPIPYFQSFDSTPINTLPTCFTVSDINADSVAWKVQNTIAASNPNSYHLATNTAATTDDWFFTPGLNLTSGVTYRLKFKYNTSSAGVYNENLRIGLGNGPFEPNMTLTLVDMPNLVNTVYQTAIVDFTPASSSVYYIGFHGYSFASQSKIVIDDISVIVSPTCFEPVSVLVTSVASTSATVTWSEPFPAPANGYQYYVSTSNTLPGAAVTPTGSVGFGIRTATITGLTPATLYYVWVRGNCSGSDQSVWSQYDSFSTDCAAAAGLTVTNGTLCGGGSTTLQAVPAPGATIEWYNDNVGTTLLATGNNFVTPTLFATTTYYARSRAPGGLILVGPSSPAAQGGSLGVQPAQTYVSFTVTAPTTLQSFDIFPMVSGQNGVLTIRNSLDVVVATYPYITSATGGTTAQTITLALNLTVGNYTLYMDTLPTAGLLTNIDGASYPFTSSVANITGNGFDNTYYLYAYNWKFSNICRSLFTPVTATVTTAPPISFSASTATICSGETTPLVTVSGYAAYTNFTWLPNNTGVSGSLAAGFTFNPTVTTPYSLVAAQTSGSLCTSVINFTVNVNPAPPAITIVPTNPSLCYGTVQALNANLAATPPVTIYSQNFNAATNDWTTTNLSSGGTPANAAWTLRPAGYNWTSSYWNPTTGGVTPVSNDNSQYYFTNSDAQGNPGPSPGRTRTYLTSPTFNLAAYTSATFSFWHYLRYSGGDKAHIEASIDGGTTWTLLTAYTATQGTASGFVNATISLNSLLGNSNVKLRFYYDVRWHWGWAVDNVKISGNLALEVNWSPATDLYFDAAATNPYIVGTPAAVIYAKPTSTITYTGSVLGAGGCSVSNTTTITISPTTVAGTLSGNQNNCASWGASNLVLSGYVGSILRWEYASDPLFLVGLTTIVNTTDTLTPAEFGVYNGDRYFRVVLQSGVCTVVNSNSVLVSFYATTWNGTAWSNGAPNATTRAVFSGNYSSTANLQACSVEVLSGNVVFNTSHTLTVQNDVRVTGGSLTFDDKSSLLQVNTLDNNGVAFTNSGNITYKRTAMPMFKFDYTYWSAPVSPQILANVSPNSPMTLFYQYNPIAGLWQNVAPASTTMVPGKGYIFRAPLSYPVAWPSTPQDFTANFIGVPNTGTITLPIIGGASQFNLLGNPYPSALSADAFLLDSDNAATLGGTLYFWTHNTGINAAYQYTGSDYAIYNYLGGVVGGVPTGPATNPGINVLPPNGKIGSGQGFFIKGLLNGTASFKNTMRLAGNNDQFFKTATQTILSNEPEKHRYWLNIANTEGAFKQALIGYADGATMGIDRLFDGEMVDVGNAVTMYTLIDNTKLSIQGRSLPFNVNDTIPLGYKSTINSTYTVTLADVDGLFTEQIVYLEDRDLNTIHNLTATPYTFTTAIGTFDNRFVLRYTDQALGNNAPVFTENSVVIYRNEADNFVVTSGSFEMASLKVFDIRGRLLLSQKEINATQTTFNEGKTNQVLLVQITTVDGVKVTKKVIR